MARRSKGEARVKGERAWASTMGAVLETVIVVAALGLAWCAVEIACKPCLQFVRGKMAEEEQALLERNDGVV